MPFDLPAHSMACFVRRALGPTDRFDIAQNLLIRESPPVDASANIRQLETQGANTAIARRGHRTPGALGTIYALGSVL